MHQHAKKKQFIPFIHSWDTVQTGHVLFLINFEFMRICITMQKKLIHWFVKEIWMIKNSCNLTDWEHFGQYLRNKILFEIWVLCRNTPITLLYGPFLWMGFDWGFYFLPLSSKKSLVLIWLTLEGWKAEKTLEPPRGFEHGTQRIYIFIME